MPNKRYDNPDVECPVCAGHGHIPAEGPDGLPVGWLPCTYCQGRKNTLWVSEKKEHKLGKWDTVRNVMAVATVGMFYSNHLWPYALTQLHFLAWLAIVVGWVVWFLNRRTSSHKQWSADGGTTYVQAPPRHAPGFTDDREKGALAVLGLGIALKGKWDQHQRQQHQQLDRIEQAQKQIQQQEYRFKNNGPS